jgi:dephospho-CoA kinase
MQVQSRNEMMITFGLTGGIACGKSTITKTFRANDIPIIDADEVARQVVAIGTPGLHAMHYAFGDDYIQEDGSLDRPRLGALVFSSKEMRDLLDAIMLPLIEDEVSSQLEKLRQEGHPMVGYDAALIIEAGYVEQFRPLIVVQCQRLTQIDRLMKRNGLTEDEAMRRISAQMPAEEKVAMADYVINADGSIENSVQQTTALIQLLRRTYL